MSDTNAREDRDLLAAEYVLGVLSAAERRQAERRLEADLAFQREVAFWEERLGGLADSISPVTPPLDGWSRIVAESRDRLRLGRACLDHGFDCSNFGAGA